MTTAEKNGDSARAVPETELASVVLHAGEMSDVTYLKDYIQVILHTLNCPPVVIGRYSAAY